MVCRSALFTLLIAGCFWSGTISAQELRGRVLQPSGEPLAFVTVRINDSVTEGVLTDIDGWFRVPEDRPVRALTLSYVGFETLRLEGEVLNARPLKIVMAPAALGLPMVEVIAGENPAHRIIREAAARKVRHDPERYPAWVCTLYNKVSVDPLPGEEAFAGKLATMDSVRAEKSRLRRDTLLSSLKERHLLFMESVVERAWLQPGRTRDRVLLNRVSGFQEGRIMALAHALQPFSFYGDHITLLETTYLNPVSRGSEQFYRFVLEDTLWQAPDTIWVIRFEPRRGAAFDGFKGVLYIHGGDYAICNVIAEPAQPGRMHLKMEQQYRRLPEGRWFPDQLIFTLSAPRYPDPTLGILIQGKTYIGEVNTEPALRLRDFDPERPLILEDDALTRNEERWERVRPLGRLDLRETGTYLFMDSLGQAEGFDRISPWLDVLETGVVSLHPKLPVRLDLRGALRANYFENTRLSLGLTNHPARALSMPRQPLLWRAWGGYGFRDRGWKYGAELALDLYRPLGLRLEGSFREDLAEPGAPFETSRANLFDRQVYAPYMDRLTEWRAGISLRPVPAITLGLDWREALQQPAYEYHYLPEWERSAFRFEELRLRFRYAAFRRNPLFGDAPLDLRTRWPVLELVYSHGLDGDVNLRPPWQRVTGSLSQELEIPGLGRCIWRVEAGMAGGDLPLSRLFTVVAPPDNAFGYLFIPGAFLTAQDLFLYDRFVNVFWRQDLGYRLWNHRLSRPRPALAHQSSFGSLNRPEAHTGLPFRTPPRGFHESGLILAELLRLNYVNVADLTLGAAFFWPWAYQDRPAALWPSPRLTMGFRF
jgi:hypothetical protein